LGNQIDKAPSKIHLSPECIQIQGTSEIVMCASLFYFRIPRGLWKDRLIKIKAMGYNCIDVYFPWNYHEGKQGQWDFSGEKNLELFLQEAADVGLWIVARPGPYICSEWDGGALPSYLFVIDNLLIRDNDSLYLQHVSRWYDQIMPILQKFELNQGGTIIAVQLENELDFYDCQDPEGYISALREMALQHHITVPLLACAGQGGLFAASGFADGVVPTCNFYPNDRDPDFEEKVLAYGQELQSRQLPLLVTETNRSHYLLRRLLSCGTKLLGPYLQASGTNFGFTNAANNWGNPLALLTSDYDFAGAISPEGHLREEAHEGRLLHHAIKAFGASFAEASPDNTKDCLIEIQRIQLESSIVGPYSLGLKLGGHLLFLTNVGSEAEEVIIKHDGKAFPRFSTLIAEANRNPMLPIGVPLQTWGIEGTLAYATAELIQVNHYESRTVMVFHSSLEAEISLVFNAVVSIQSGTMEIHEQTEHVTVTFSGANSSSVIIRLDNGHQLELIGIHRTQALLLKDMDEAGSLIFTNLITPESEMREVETSWMVSAIRDLANITDNKISLGDQANYLEKHDVFKGYAWYTSRTTIPAFTACKGVLLQHASDVISLYADGSYLGTVTPGGGDQFIACQTNLAVNPTWLARAEIWGHTNFNDARLPALRLSSLKGLTGLVAVTSIKNISQNWRFQIVQNREIKDEWISVNCEDQSWTLTSWGGWFSSKHPSFQYYRKQINSSYEADSWTLHFPGIQVLVEVFVNGIRAESLNPLSPYLDITPWVKAGQPIFLSIWMDRGFGLPTGEVILYEGNRAKEWSLSSAVEKELLQHAESLESRALSVELPIELKPGEMAWVYGNLRDSNDGNGWRVFCDGSHMKLSVFFNGHLVGRLWTGNGISRPVFSGGSQQSFYLPGPWFNDSGNEWRIMLEAVELGERASLDALRFFPV
jgi:beta-galactosidase